MVNFHNKTLGVDTNNNNNNNKKKKKKKKKNLHLYSIFFVCFVFRITLDTQSAPQ